MECKSGQAPLANDPSDKGVEFKVSGSGGWGLVFTGLTIHLSIKNPHAQRTKCTQNLCEHVGHADFDKLKSKPESLVALSFHAIWPIHVCQGRLSTYKVSAEGATLGIQDERPSYQHLLLGTRDSRHMGHGDSQCGVCMNYCGDPFLHPLSIKKV